MRVKKLCTSGAATQPAATLLRRRGSDGVFTHAHHVPGTAHTENWRGFFYTRPQLATQIADMRVDTAIEPKSLASQRTPRDLTACDNAPSIPHEQLENAELRIR